MFYRFTAVVLLFIIFYWTLSHKVEWDVIRFSSSVFPLLCLIHVTKAETTASFEIEKRRDSQPFTDEFLHICAQAAKAHLPKVSQPFQ